MKKYRLLIVAMVLMGVGLCILATGLRADTPILQPANVTNPSGVTFTASLDHTRVDSYVMGVFLPGELQPITEINIGKPTPDAQNTCTATINIMPLAFGTNYTAKVRAVANAATSEWSDASNPFDRIPGKPGGPVIIRR